MEIKFDGAFVLNRRVDLHAIDAPPARWRGGVGSSPLDGASTAASSLRNDSLISTQDARQGPVAANAHLGRGGDDAGDAVLLGRRGGRGAEHPFKHAREGPECRGWEDDEDGEQPPEARRVCARGWRFSARRCRIQLWGASRASEI